MANITLLGASYTDVPSVDLPQTGGGTVRFYESGVPSATRHTLLFEYTDETSTTEYAYYDDAFIGSAITATTPTEHGGKEVQTASLDGVEWYVKPTYQFETIFDDNVSWYTETTGPKAYCWITQLGDVEITLGSVWRITIAGHEYVTTGKLHTETGAVYIGNVRYVYGFDYEEDEPVLFGLERYNNQAWVGTTDLVEPETHSRVKIERAITT